MQTEAQLQSYKENGFEEYEYMACHNRDVCANCKALDGKIFKIDDGMPGENAPPMHPSCHCATTAHMDLNAYEKWLDGYSEHGMSFKEWQENKNDARTKKRGIINKAKVNTVFTSVSYTHLSSEKALRRWRSIQNQDLDLWYVICASIRKRSAPEPQKQCDRRKSNALYGSNSR